MENKSKIRINIFVDSNEEFQKFKENISGGLDGTLAIISNDKAQYELYAEEDTLYIYKSEKNEAGEFETMYRYNASEWINDTEDLEELARKLIKLFM